MKDYLITSYKYDILITSLPNNMSKEKIINLAKIAVNNYLKKEAITDSFGNTYLPANYPVTQLYNVNTYCNNERYKYINKHYDNDYDSFYKNTICVDYTDII